MSKSRDGLLWEALDERVIAEPDEDILPKNDGLRLITCRNGVIRAAPSSIQAIDEDSDSQCKGRARLLTGCEKC